MSYLGKIDNMPLYSTVAEALLYGKQYNITKQRVHQIISCCRISGGDYYAGRKLAREYKTEIQTKQDAKVLFKQWLQEKGVKIALNNKDFTTYA